MIAEVELPIHLAGDVVREFRHACALINSIVEARELLGTFVAEGQTCGQKGFHIVNPDEVQPHLAWLASLHIDINGARASGLLEVKTWDETYLQGERFDQEAWLSQFETTLNEFDRQDFPTVRIMADMEWALQDRPGVGDLVEYESRANDILAQHKHVGVCVYNISKFKGDVVMDILRTHPLVIVGGVLHRNPFFLRTAEFLDELRARRARLAAQPASTPG